MTKTQTLVDNIGLSNLITIGILIVGLTGTFVGLSSQMKSVTSKLENEIVDRKVEDERIRMSIGENWDNNAIEHKAIVGTLANINESIQKLDNTMNFHIGYHEGIRK